jgi:hypothetical protein
MRIIARPLCALAATAALATLATPAAPAAPAQSTATVVTIRVVKGRPVGGIKRPSVTKGTVVRFVVVADRGKRLHLHGYDVEKIVRPGRATVIQIVARIPGRFELELHDPDAVLARLTVRP